MTPSSRLEIEKTSWRKTLRARLSSLEEPTARRGAATIAESTLALREVVSAAGVLACLSFGHEVDTWGLVDELLERGHSVFVPRIALGEDPRLHVHPYPCRLETLPFGLRQPLVGEPELEPAAIDATLDLALILGLGFDRRGYRLGYGRGYFDRFLAGRPLTAVGLAYELQLVDRLPAGFYDVPMDIIVTELGVSRFPVRTERPPSAST